MVLFADNFASSQVTCLSSAPQTFAKLFSGLTIPAGMEAKTYSDFHELTWPEGAAEGTYTFFMALAKPGAFADGAIDGGDIVEIGSDAVSYER